MYLQLYMFDRAVCERDYIYDFHYHLIWVTKYQNPAFTTPELVDEMKNILLQLSEMKEICIEEMEIMPDHIHLFLDFDPRLSLHAVVKSMKGRSARVLRSEFPSLKTRLPNLWTRNYFMCTVGHVNEDTIKQYIEAQKQHQ